MPECGCGMQRKIGIAQHFPREQHYIGFSLADDPIWLLRGGDQAYGSGADLRFLPDPAREGHLIAGADRNLLLQRTPA